MLRRVFQLWSVVVLTAVASMNIGNVARAASGGAIEFAQEGYSISQTAKSITVTVKRSGGSSGAATVHYTTDRGTGVYGRDYAHTAGTLRWANGESSPKSITVAIIDAKATVARTFSVALSLPSGTNEEATLGTPSVASIVITPSGSGSGTPTAQAGDLALAAPSYSIPANWNALTVVVQRTGGSHGSVSVEHATINGTAVSGQNYTATSGTLSWADGDTSSKSFVVPITNSSFSGNKTFTIALSNATGGAAVSAPSAASVMIHGTSAPAPTPVPPPTPNPPTSTPSSGGITSPVFTDGKFHWGGDWNAVPFNYSYGASGVSGPGPVIYMPGDTEWEYWLPYPPSNSGGPASNGVNFDLSGLTYFTIAIKPSQAGAAAQMEFFRATGGTNDIPYGNVVDISQGKYGPANMVAGQWNVYTIPLADFGVSGWIYKFIIQQQGVTPQAWEIDQVGFK